MQKYKNAYYQLERKLERTMKVHERLQENVIIAYSRSHASGKNYEVVTEMCAKSAAAVV